MGAMHFVESLAETDGVVVDDRIVASVRRAARGCTRTEAKVISERLRDIPGGVGESNFGIAKRGRGRYVVARGAEAESELRACANVRELDKVWNRIRADCILSSQVGVLAAYVATLGRFGQRERALNELMTWMRKHVYDAGAGCVKEDFAEDTSSMALLLTCATKTVADAARSAPNLALMACDVLSAVKIGGEEGSLPMTGAYFKVLQHVRLGLKETKSRIYRAWEDHVQLDERAFSMALGALLKCNARVADKLKEGHEWVEIMKSAGIPLTVHTFNFFAGQMRYCHDPDMVTRLLADMCEAEVVPTSVTYGLLFGACVIPGDYLSERRKVAPPVVVWERVLEGLEEHMFVSQVEHTANSRLSLARAYAHLGKKTRALDEFQAYLDCCGSASGVAVSKRVEDAYRQMIYNFAHCRECSSEGPDAAVLLHEQMQERDLGARGEVLDSLLVSCVRMGKARQAANFASEFGAHGSMILSECGVKHLLKSLIELRDPDSVQDVWSILKCNNDLLSSQNLRHTVEELVISLARIQREDLCNDLMEVAQIEVADLEYVLKGREFLRFRTLNSRKIARVKEEGIAAVLPNGPNAAEATRSQIRQSVMQYRSRSLHDESVIPIA